MLRKSLWKLQAIMLKLIQSIDYLGHNHYFHSFLLGCLLTTAFAPLGILPAIIFSFSGLLILLERYKNKQKYFWLGWFFGFGHFMTSLYWFSHALLSDPYKFGWMIPFALTLIPAVLGVFTGLVTYGVSYFASSRIIRMISFISLWVIVEMLRSYFIIPFPWNLLGYAIVAADSPMQIISLVGIFGCSLLLAFIGSFFYTRNFKVIVSALLVGCFVWGYGSYRLQNKTNDRYENFKIRIVQPSILEHPMGSKTKQYLAMKKLVELSFLQRTPEVKLVIWPEAAFPYAFIESDTNPADLSKISPKQGAFVFGTDRVTRNLETNDIEFYNSIMAISRDAEVVAVYDKKTLVPFGEYIPFKKFIPFVQKVTHGMEDFSSGKNASNVMRIDGIPPFLPLICYETIFPNLHHAGAEWILNITNDAWFGKSIGPHQHFAMSRLRAVEYGLPVIRVANNGISALISPYGEILQKLGTNDVGIMDVNLPKDIATPSDYIKHLFSAIPFLLLLIAILLERRAIKAKIK
jgi:apolipoprotein N-acyltransferase